MANKTSPRKITPRTMADYQGIDLIKLGDTRPVAARVLYELYGRVVGFKQRDNDYGTWTQFKGEFEAVIPSSGEIVRAFAMHIPIIEDQILARLEAAKESGEGSYVDLAVAVGIEPAPSGKPSATGYVYVVTPLLALSSDSPIARLRAQVDENRKALPNPNASPPSESAQAPRAVGGHGRKR